MQPDQICAPQPSTHLDDNNISMPRPRPLACTWRRSESYVSSSSHVCGEKGGPITKSGLARLSSPIHTTWAFWSNTPVIGFDRKSVEPPQNSNTTKNPNKTRIHRRPPDAAPSPVQPSPAPGNELNDSAGARWSIGFLPLPPPVPMYPVCQSPQRRFLFLLVCMDKADPNVITENECARESGRERRETNNPSVALELGQLEVSRNPPKRPSAPSAS